MRERWIVYAGLAGACAASAWSVMGHAHLLQTFATGDPSAALRARPMNVVLVAALIAVFFVLPGALRRIQPTFRMTLWRGAMTLVMLAIIGVVTDLGYAAAVIPGVVIGVLLSQALIAALLRTTDRPTLHGFALAVADSLTGSYRMTRGHFATTLGIVAVSLAILGVPFFFGLCAMLVLDVLFPPSLVAMAPLLFLQFVYCECLRYVIVVRWYARLGARSSNPPLRPLRVA